MLILSLNDHNKLMDISMCVFIFKITYLVVHVTIVQVLIAFWMKSISLLLQTYDFELE